MLQEGNISDLGYELEKHRLTIGSVLRPILMNEANVPSSKLIYSGFSREKMSENSAVILAAIEALI